MKQAMAMVVFAQYIGDMSDIVYARIRARMVHIAMRAEEIARRAFEQGGIL
jgi:hypothetical protein